MPTLPNWNLSQQSRARMTELLQSAAALGLNPDAVAAGGLAALQGLIALGRAKDAGEGAGREALIGRTQEALRGRDPATHGDLLQQFQARILALQGRGGDTDVAHVTPGEIVLPKALQTPAVLGALRGAAAAANIPLDQLRVGSPANRINPETGAAEFAQAAPVDPVTPEIHIEARKPIFDQERDIRDLGLMIFGEGAEDWDKEGTMEHIGWTAVNRVGAPTFGTTVSEVVRHPDYDSYNNPLWRQAETTPETLDPLNAKAYRRAQEVARGILEGKIPDPTGGAQFFFHTKRKIEAH